MIWLRFSVCRTHARQSCLYDRHVCRRLRKIERFIFAVVRGDMDVNETKLLNAVDAKALRTATEEEFAPSVLCRAMRRRSD